MTDITNRITAGSLYSMPIFTDGSCSVTIRVDSVDDEGVHYSRLDGCQGGVRSASFIERHCREIAAS